MKQFSVPMAIIDYIPVTLFALAALMIFKNLRNKMSKVNQILFICGAVLVTCAGGLKATYKLLYALNVGDFIWMNNQMFTNQALGFLLAGIAVVFTAVKPQRSRVYGLLPTPVLILMMVAGLGAMDAGLCFIANMMKKRNALACFIISFFFSLMMGYLSSRDFDKAFMNWMAQGINICGQLLLLIGCKILDKAGLKDAVL